MLIKLDTQGTELEILQGLSDAQFADVLAVEVETEFHTAYRGQPCFPEMHAFMTGQGFELFDMRTQRVFLTGGQEANHYIKTFLDTAVGTRQLAAKLHAADAFYIRPFTSMVDTMTLEQFGHYATILQMYRAYDVIFWLLDQPRMRDLLGVQGHFEVVSAYVAAAPRPRFIERSGPVPLALRRGRRAASMAVERLLGGEGFRRRGPSGPTPTGPTSRAQPTRSAQMAWRWTAGSVRATSFVSTARFAARRATRP